MGINKKIKSNLPVVIHRPMKAWSEIFLYLRLERFFFCICARTEMSFEIFGFLREDFFLNSVDLL